MIGNALRPTIEFLAVAVLLVIIPGPAVVLILKNALLHGRVYALATAFGVLTADMVWVLISSAGLTALLVSSQLAFDVVRYVGATFLIYLGLRLLMTRTPKGLSPEAVTVEGLPGGLPLSQAHLPGTPGTRKMRLRAFREGLLCDLSNPKTVITFTSIIPQFMDAPAHPADTIRLGVLFALTGFGSLLMYTAVFSAASKALQDPARLGWILRGGGATLLAFGLGMLTTRPASG